MNLGFISQYNLQNGAKMDYCKYYSQLDILKGLAIVAVIIGHSLPNQFCVILTTFTTGIAVPVFLFIMGLNAAMSYKRREYSTFNEMYDKDYLKSRFLRLVPPFLFIFIISLLMGLLIHKSLYFGFFTLIGFLPLTGPGNYFITIIFEFVLLFPLLYFFYRKNPKLILSITFILSFIFEIVANQSVFFSNNSYIYSANILRYIFLITLGLWTADNFDPTNLTIIFRNNYIIGGFVLSLIYMVLFAIFKLKFSFFQPSWQPQNVISFFYPFLICLVAITYLPSVPGKISSIFALFGKASYHIFLLQIVIFAIILNSGLILNHFSLMGGHNLLIIFTIIINLIIILSLGVLFFKLETRLTTKYWVN